MRQADGAARWKETFGVMNAAAAGQGSMPLHTVYMGGDMGSLGPEPEPEPEGAAEASGGAGSPKRYHLLVYTQPPASLVFVFEHPDGPDEHGTEEAARGAGPDLTDFTHFLKPMLEQELMNLAQAIGARAKPTAGAEFRFVYFNRMNLCVKVSDGFGANSGDGFGGARSVSLGAAAVCFRANR